MYTTDMHFQTEEVILTASTKFEVDMILACTSRAAASGYHVCRGKFVGDTRFEQSDYKSSCSDI